MGMHNEKRVTLACGKGRTKQAFRDQVNINKIIERNRKTGMLDFVTSKQPFYGDVSEIGSYQESLNVVMKAQELFAGMSASVRRRFQNDPLEMIEFLKDEKNREEAIELGIVAKPKEPEPEKIQKVEIVAGQAPESKK